MSKENLNKPSSKDIILSSLKGVAKTNKQSSSVVATIQKQSVFKKKNAKVVQYKDIKSNDSWRIKINLFDWNNRDFALYILNSYSNRYKDKYQANIVGVVTYMGWIKKQVHNVMGFCDNVVLKDYIDFFFRKWSDFFKSRQKGVWHLQYLRKSQAIKQFVTQYSYQNRMKYYNDALGKYGISQIDLNSEFNSNGLQAFIIQYGIVTAVNYLVMSKNKQVVDGVKQVARCVVGIYAKNVSDYNKLRTRTFTYSPYPQKFIVKNFNKLFEAIDERTKDPIFGQIKFKDSQKWNF